MNLLQKFASLFIPTSPAPVYDHRFDTAPVAKTMDVDKLAGILSEAEGGDTQRLFRLGSEIVLSDTHVSAQVTTRKLSILGHEARWTPWSKSPEDVATCDVIQGLWDQIPDKMGAMSHLLFSFWFPVSVLQRQYRPSQRDGLRYELADITPVGWHLLDYTTGKLQIRDVDPATHVPLATMHDPDPRKYVIHRGHLLTSFPDNWGGPMRAALFWWLFKTQDRHWWMRFLERFGSPFIVVKSESLADGTKRLLKQAMSEATKVFGLIVSKETQVELQGTNTSQGGDAFEKMHEVANRELSKLIVGQTMTAEASANGFSGAQSVVHQDVKGEYANFDNIMLAQTLREQIALPLVLWNGLPGKAPRVRFGAEDAGSLTETTEFVKALPTSNLELDDDGLDLLIRKSGFGLRRMAAVGAPTSPLAMAALSAELRDRLATNAAADIQRTFGGAFADVRRACLAAKDAPDLERRLQAALAGLPVERQASAIREVMESYALAPL